MWRVTTTFTGAPVTGGGICRLYFQSSIGTAAEAAAAVAGFWDDISAVQVNTITNTIEGFVEEVDETTGEITGFATTDTVVHVGQNAQDPLPKASMGLLRWRTGEYVSGREVRGRIFIPGLLEANNTGGVPTSSLKTAVETAAAQMIQQEDAHLVVFSRAHHVGVDVVSADFWSEWAILTSRRD